MYIYTYFHIYRYKHINKYIFIGNNMYFMGLPPEKIDMFAPLVTLKMAEKNEV